MKNIFTYFIRIKTLLFCLTTVAFPLYGQEEVWKEDFTGYENSTTTGRNKNIDNSSADWRTEYAGLGGVAPFFWLGVHNTDDGGVTWRAKNVVDSKARWISEVIDISDYENVLVEFSGKITFRHFSPSDDVGYVKFYYKVDDGSEELFFESYSNPEQIVNQEFSPAMSEYIEGNTLQLIAEVYGFDRTRFLSDFYLDQVIVRGYDILYSRASGNWSNFLAVWSRRGHDGIRCFCAPSRNTPVIIGDGDTITINNRSEQAYSAGLTIKNGGTLVSATSDNVLTVEYGGDLIIEPGANIDLDGDTLSLRLGTLLGGNQIIQNQNTIINVGQFINIKDLTVLEDVNVTFIGTEDVNVAGKLEFDGANSIVTNQMDGKLTVGGYGITVTSGEGNQFVNNGDMEVAAIDGGSSNFTFINANTINQTGEFANIGAGSTFTNLTGAQWYYAGETADATLNEAMVLTPDDNHFYYTGNTNQEVIGTTYHDITVDGTGTKTALGNIEVQGNLTLNEGHLKLVDDAFSIPAGNISGGSSASYIITGGNGEITQTGVGAGDIYFPVGDENSYSPVTINNAGEIDDFSVRVCSALNENGDCLTGEEPLEDVVNKTYFIEEATAGGADVTLTLAWEDGDEMAITDERKMNMIHFNGTEWEAVGANLDGSENSITAAGIRSFSPFAASGDGVFVLPVTLIRFGGVAADNKVLLEWITATEINNHYFIVEKSPNGKWYEELARVEGNGNSEKKLTYKVADNAPYAGNNYYRLVQYDFDGKATGYDPVSVFVEPRGKIQARLYPMPNDGSVLFLEIPPVGQAHYATLSITDLQGQLIHQEPLTVDAAEGTKKRIDLQGKLSKGIYVLYANLPNPLIRKIVIE